MTYAEIMTPYYRNRYTNKPVSYAKVLQQLVDHGHIIPVGHHGPCRSLWSYGLSGCRGKLE